LSLRLLRWPAYRVGSFSTNSEGPATDWLHHGDRQSRACLREVQPVKRQQELERVDAQRSGPVTEAEGRCGPWRTCKNFGARENWPGFAHQKWPTSLLPTSLTSMLLGRTGWPFGRIWRAPTCSGRHSWTFSATFPLIEGPYTPPAWMTRGQTPHAFGVDDAFLVLALVTTCSWCGSL